MIEYQEIRTARRGIQLIRNSNMDFSVLNFMAYCVMIALVIAAVISVFKG